MLRRRGGNRRELMQRLWRFAVRVLARKSEFEVELTF